MASTSSSSSSSSTPPDSPQTFYRKMLAASIGSICLGEGFDTIEKDCLGILVEMLQCCECSYKILLGNESYSHCFSFEPNGFV